MTPSLGIEPGPHWWEASALITAPSLHPFNPLNPLNPLNLLPPLPRSQLSCSYN